MIDIPKLTPPEMVANNTVLLSEIGSTAHGTNVETSDHDFMGIFIEPPHYVLGTEQTDQWVSSTGGDDKHNEAHDVDATIYSLQKFVKLALNSNPSILTMFFAQPTEHTIAGEAIRAASSLFISKHAAPRFLGYMKSQMERLKGERGRKGVIRPELLEQFGYDTKYAYHIARLAIQGKELMLTGRITLPVPEVDRMLLMQIRKGYFKQDECLEVLESLEGQLKTAIEHSELPDEPDRDKVNQLMTWLYTTHWGWSMGFETERNG